MHGTIELLEGAGLVTTSEATKIVRFTHSSENRGRVGSVRKQSLKQPGWAIVRRGGQEYVNNRPVILNRTAQADY